MLTPQVTYVALLIVQWCRLSAACGSRNSRQIGQGDKTRGSYLNNNAQKFVNQPKEKWDGCIIGIV